MIAGGERCDSDGCIALASHEIVSEEGIPEDGVLPGGRVRALCEGCLAEMFEQLEETSREYHRLVEGGTHPRVAERRVAAMMRARSC